MAEGEGALGGEAAEKRHKNDFALWKSSKPGEPAWDSPWGRGRPGWHIECSVIASDILGPNLDVHAGGVDLKFPHHDNELAQSEAFYGHAQWVNYFFHAGHLDIKGLKMSKSLKNFITIRQALEKHSPRQIRLMFLLQPWDRGMNYSDQTVGDAKAKEALFRNFFGAVKAVLSAPGPAGHPNKSAWLAKEVGWTNGSAEGGGGGAAAGLTGAGASERALARALAACSDAVHAGMCHNFDTPAVLAALCGLVKEVNTYLAAVGGGEVEASRPAASLLRKCALHVTKVLRVLGVVEGADEVGFPLNMGEGAGGGSSEELIGPYLDAFRDFRHEVSAPPPPPSHLSAGSASIPGGASDPCAYCGWRSRGFRWWAAPGAGDAAEQGGLGGPQGGGGGRAQGLRPGARRGPPAPRRAPRGPLHRHLPLEARRPPGEGARPMSLASGSAHEKAKKLTPPHTHTRAHAHARTHARTRVAHLPLPGAPARDRGAGRGPGRRRPCQAREGPRRRP